MIMEFKLFHSRSVSVSEIVCSGRTSQNQSYRQWSGVGNHIQYEKLFCSCKGILMKASYSTPRKSKQSVDWVGQDKFAVGNGSPWIMEMNGVSFPSSSLAEWKILDASEDDYNGIVIDPERLPSSPETFSDVIRSSLSHWRAMGKKGIWLKLPVERSELVPIAVKEGFQYHHAEPEYLMLTYWLPNEPCMLPANASHQVGVGGFVINDKDELLISIHSVETLSDTNGDDDDHSQVLVVLEKQPATPACVGLWKIPTGFIHESEEIFTGVVREVKEETGIDTEFVEVVAFRHAHQVAFEKSDLFFICMLQPLSTQIQVDDLEIIDAKWMPINEFVQQPKIKGDNMFKKIIEICIARLGKRYCGLSCHQVISKFDGKSSSLYYNVVRAEDAYCKGT